MLRQVIKAHVWAWICALMKLHTLRAASLEVMLGRKPGPDCSRWAFLR